jgi:uncharacterized NAD(P)/FAD-binding protein YdhS
VRAQVRKAAGEGQPWQAVFDDIRANARRLWAALDITERRRLLRHLRPYWDVHRFRIAPQAERTIARLRQRGQFSSLAAALRGARWDGAEVRVQLHRLGLGLEVDDLNHAVGADGSANHRLLVVGPLARGHVGELMGLPQVSEHAESVAATAMAAMVLMVRGPRAAAFATVPKQPDVA